MYWIFRIKVNKSSQVAPRSKESAWQFRRHKRCWFSSWVRKIPWSRKWQPIVFLPRKFHGQRSLVGYSPKGCKKSDMSTRMRQNVHFLAYRQKNTEENFVEVPYLNYGSNYVSVSIFQSWFLSGTLKMGMRSDEMSLPRLGSKNLWPRNSTERYITQIWKTGIQTDLYSNTIYNRQKEETTQVFIHGWTDKQHVSYYSAIKSNKVPVYITTWMKLKTLWKCYSAWKRPDTKGHILCDPFIKQTNPWRWKADWWLPRDAELGMGNDC